MEWKQILRIIFRLNYEILFKSKAHKEGNTVLIVVGHSVELGNSLK